MVRHVHMGRKERRMLATSIIATWRSLKRNNTRHHCYELWGNGTTRKWMPGTEWHHTMHTTYTTWHSPKYICMYVYIYIYIRCLIEALLFVLCIIYDLLDAACRFGDFNSSIKITGFSIQQLQTMRGSHSQLYNKDLFKGTFHVGSKL